jgi:hypothetical protein
LIRIETMLRLFSSDKNKEQTQLSKCLTRDGLSRSTQKIEDVNLIDRFQCPMGDYDLCVCRFDGYCLDMDCCYLE